MKSPLRIGTRGSDLALWQARYVNDRLVELGLTAQIVIIKTKGDQIQDIGFDKMEGKGFFTKEIEEALLRDEIDLAIHSYKDLETTMPDGLAIAAVPQRSFVNDILIIRSEAVDPKHPFKLKEGSVVGSSSARRKALLLAHLPTCTSTDLRGNVPTRINKLREGHYDAILLAKAGVTRLNLDLSEFTVVDLDPEHFVPAPAQGALAIQMKTNHPAFNEVHQLHNAAVADVIEVEREALRRMEGGCKLPFGAYCVKNGNTYSLTAAYSPSYNALPALIQLTGTSKEAL
ncbi:MAG: hydroxymethylbilane synthase, partial [Bacteroidota bacterium]